MSEEAKKLLLRLKKEKKVDKQIDLIRKLEPYNQEEMVNVVLLKHLERKDLDTLRLEILSSLNPHDDHVIKPLAALVTNKNELQVVREKAIALLGQNKGNKALGALLSSYKKVKDLTILDNITFALTSFEDKRVEKPIIKALANDELRLQTLTGLAKNENLLLSSLQLIKAVMALEVTKSLEGIHYTKILNTLGDEFGYTNKEDIVKAIKDKSIEDKIRDYAKKQKDIDKVLRKVQQ
ncbi:MAG: hypothetical protein FK733_03350 [Asgard group archaeon]|nr:hypothetical protein [Asgard group archaeon]